MIGAGLVAYLSAMGPATGMAQIPASRLPFGKSIVVPGLLNWLRTIGWDGINSIFGAVAITLLIPALPFWAALLIIIGVQALLVRVHGGDAPCQARGFTAHGLPSTLFYRCILPA